MSYINTLISGEFSIVAMALLEALQAFLNQLMGHLTATSTPCGRDYLEPSSLGFSPGKASAEFIGQIISLSFPQYPHL